MKKNVFKLTLGSAVAVAAGYTTYASRASVELAGVAMDNVEALASGESGGLRTCAEGTDASWNDPSATFQMKCSPCGSYGYMHASDYSKC